MDIKDKDFLQTLVAKHSVDEIYKVVGTLEQNMDVKVGDYAFEVDGEIMFSSCQNAYPNYLGIVGWLNNNQVCSKEDKGLIIASTGVLDVWEVWRARFYEVQTSKTFGFQNTQDILEYGQKHDILFPAAKYCDAYSSFEIGGWFLPAIHQLEEICKQMKECHKNICDYYSALMACDGILWSSSEDYMNVSFAFDMKEGCVTSCYKDKNNFVLPVLSF